MRFISSTFLFASSLVLFTQGQAPPDGLYTISNPKSGLFFDLQDPSANFNTGVVGNPANGHPSQAWYLSNGGRLTSANKSLTPLYVYTSGAEGAELAAFFRAFATFDLTSAGGGLLTLDDGGFVVTAGGSGDLLTIQAPASGAAADLQKWKFTPTTVPPQ